MSTSATYTRPIRRTSDGYFLERATTISHISLVAGGYDARLDLYDGGPDGQIIWSTEADNATLAIGENFNPPMKFYNKVYGKFTSDAPLALSSFAATVCVIEP